MKLSKITLLVALLGVVTLSVAEDLGTTPVDIDAQIAEIQAASPEKRVQLMNDFKQQLASMNEAERAATISQMQEKMHTNVDATQAMAQTRTREMMQNQQIQANEQTIQMQNMNQLQAGNQFNHINMSESMIGGGTTDRVAGSSGVNFMNR